MNKTINISTLNNYFNYGNRLQLFALCKTVRKLSPGRVKIYNPRKIASKIKEIIKYMTPLSCLFKKESSLKAFTKRNIGKCTSNNRCDYLIIGSDQVWNPDYLLERPYLLNADGGKKIISYAASIGKEDLTYNQKEVFKNELTRYEKISVREQSAKELLQPLVDKKIEVVLDPTFLIDENEYEELEIKPKNIKENDKYILCYILGGREQMSAIKRYASKNNYKVIIFSDKNDSEYGIGEFLYLIHHAQIICTDSFHACVFSFIFGRPFIAFKRTGEANYMYTRLKNLIDTFKLKNREFNGIEITDENVNVDYSYAKKILKREQKKSIDFLKNALEVDDEK